jgi:hypothetical protein
MHNPEVIMIAFLSTAVLVLAAGGCPAVNELTVTASGVAGITCVTTLSDIEAMFGAENIENTREHMGEGYYSECTVINGGTDNELSVVWNPGEGISSVAEIRIRGSGLHTAEGIGLGSSLIELESVIGEFEVAGFAWDGEGYVVLEGTCCEGLFIRVTPALETVEHNPGLITGFSGDTLFPSSAMRELNPVITDFRIRF